MRFPQECWLYRAETVLDEQGNKVKKVTDNYIVIKCVHQPTAPRSTDEVLKDGQQRGQYGRLWTPLGADFDAYARVRFPDEQGMPFWEIVGDPKVWIGSRSIRTSRLKYRVSTIRLIGGSDGPKR